MKKLILFLILLTGTKSTAQLTPIADSRFERALIDLGIDSDQTINGHLLTIDALAVTELNLSPNTIPDYPYPASNIYDGMIHDLSGIEAFVNLEQLKINVTMVDQLNLSSLIRLKHFDCVDSMLTSIDVSNNPLLEYLDISGGGDVLPVTDINEIDLSNNPNLTTLKASGVEKINLKNNNNTQPISVNASCNYCWDFPPEVIVGSVCIEVDNAELAQNNQAPYVNWTVLHSNILVNYTDDLSQCSLGIRKLRQNDIVMYPNPTKSGVVYLKADERSTYSIEIFDNLGRKIIEEREITDGIDVSRLQKGNYFMRIISGNGSSTEKLIVE